MKRYNLIGCVTHKQSAPRFIFFHEVIPNSLAHFRVRNVKISSLSVMNSVAHLRCPR
jgi:hypothetical protein